MKQMILTNNELITVGDALRELTTEEFPVNRAKHRLLKLVDKKFEEFVEDEKMLLDQYTTKDGDGELVILENGQRDIPKKDVKQVQKEVNDLAKIEVVIEYGEVARDIKPIIEYILEYKGHISAKMGQGLFELIEAYELSQQTEEEK